MFMQAIVVMTVLAGGLLAVPRPAHAELQNIIYVGAAEMPKKPYPAVDGIKRVMQLFDSAAMRRFKPEDFYDDSFMRELDQSGFIDALYR